MRMLIVVAALFLVGLVSASVVVDSLSVHHDNGASSLSWHNGDRVLGLESDGTTAIRVIKAEPDEVFGLRQGDEILAVDGEPVRGIEDLLDHLRARQPNAVELLIRRGNAEQVVALAASEYQSLLPTPTPEPPAPPSPPKPESGG